MFDKETIFKVKNDSFVTRKVGNEMVLVPLVDNVADMTSVITLNETGTFILEALNGENSIKQGEMKLYEAFNVEIPILQEDLQEFINQALNKNIIEKVL